MLVYRCQKECNTIDIVVNPSEMVYSTLIVCICLSPTMCARERSTEQSYYEDGENRRCIMDGLRVISDSQSSLQQYSMQHILIRASKDWNWPPLTPIVDRRIVCAALVNLYHGPLHEVVIAKQLIIIDNQQLIMRIISDSQFHFK